jgi:hypothetical protein
MKSDRRGTARRAPHLHRAEAGDSVRRVLGGADERMCDRLELIGDPGYRSTLPGFRL